MPSGYTHIVTRKEIIPDTFRRVEADMYGAILGDIIGSPFEFDRGNKAKNFELFTRGCGFTDDSVMTVSLMYTGEIWRAKHNGKNNQSDR